MNIFREVGRNSVGGRSSAPMMRNITRAIAGLLFLASFADSSPATAETSEGVEAVDSVQAAHKYVYENYDKRVYQVPMRDGKALHTQVYTPKDQSGSYPILLVRTPYRPFFHRGGIDGYFGLLGPGPGFIEEGYIFVVQDVRGRFLSEGDYVVMRPNTANWEDTSQVDESTDAYDTIDWLVKNVDNNNGKVGTHGVSYPGTFSALALVNAHPAVSVALIEAPAAEMFIGDDYAHNGAQQLLYPFMWLNNIGLAKRDGPSDELQAPICQGNRPTEGIHENFYSFFLNMGPVSRLNEICFQHKVSFWNQMMEHETYDTFWQERSIGQYMKNIEEPAILVVGSWFDDQDLYGTLHTYNAIETQNPKASVSLIMGVWNHAKWWDQKKEPWGKAQLPVKETGEYYRREILLPFFNHHLKGAAAIDVPEVTTFETGTNVWREYSEWPVKNTESRKLYLGSGGQLRDTRPTGESTQFDTYVSDPADPVPQIPAEQMWGWTAEVMQFDQRFAAARDDVLVFSGDALSSDLTVVGPIEVELYVSTSGTDADWVVKLIDVFPQGEGEQSGYQMLIRGDIMRGKFRNSFEDPEPFTPDEITKISFDLPDVNHTFLEGHRLMVQIQSTWFPMFDRNPQTFVNIREAAEEDFQTATHRVYRSRSHPSHITLDVLPERERDK